MHDRLFLCRGTLQRALTHGMTMFSGYNALEDVV